MMVRFVKRNIPPKLCSEPRRGAQVMIFPDWLACFEIYPLLCSLPNTHGVVRKDKTVRSQRG